MLIVVSLGSVERGGGGCQHTQSWLTHPHAHIGSSTQGVVSPAVSPDEEDADGPLPISLGSVILEDVSAEKARMIQTLDSESPVIALLTLQNTISCWEYYSQLDDDQKRDFRMPARRLVALAERMIANAAHVYETDAHAARLLCKSVLEELVIRFDDELEHQKELILWHETTVKSNAKMHGHALYAVQETAKMLKSSRDELEVVRAECQAASSSLTTEHALVVEQVTG
jgi:hypothetical protein